MACCQECGFDWDSPLAHARDTVEAFPARASHLLRFGPDARLRARPAVGVWSPLEYLAHTGDAIDWYAGRIARVLTEQRPRLDGYDWDAHTAEQEYHRRAVEDVLDDIRRSCSRFAVTTADLDEAASQLAGVRSDGTPRTIAQLIHRAAHEARHHLRDIELGLTGSASG